MTQTRPTGTRTESKCPCCGGRLLGAGLQWIRKAQVLIWKDCAARLSPIETTVFDMLWRARNTGEVIPAEQISYAVHKSARGGGPGSQNKNVANIAFHLRQKIKGSGLTVCGQLGCFGGYRLSAAPKAARTAGEEVNKEG